MSEQLSAGEKTKVSISFSTLSGKEQVQWTLAEALKSEFADNVRSLILDPAAIGCTISHQAYGRVTIEIVGRE